MRRVSAPGQLALWIGRKGRGSARLRWGGRDLTVFVAGLQVVAVEGDDGGRLEGALGLTSGREWFAEAVTAAAAGQVTQAEANAVVKRALAELLREWILASDGTVTFESRPVPEPQGLTISYPHLMIEMLLGTGGEELVRAYLPDPALVLHRLPDFPRRVGLLGLTDEAMAVFAKITDRTALEIAEPSPHGKDTALRLLAAAVAAGLVETAPRIVETPAVAEEPLVERPRSGARALRWALALLALAVVAVVLVIAQPWSRKGAAGSGGPWGIAVDMGCESREVERLYRTQNRDRDSFRVVRFMQGDQPCFRLVWGHFPDRESAERAKTTLPDGVLTRGFSPHVVLPESTSP